ncbi:GIY-YIG nuclease family protein [Gammaproteobacteria bacterium LSUCC0112]|nr:GIY-YIG nuclease family protein [Gammaproteobacteria bacterium LSUCC0112]
MTAAPWYVYIIQCGDQSLYTGIAKDVSRRFDEHQSQGRLCARYLRGRTPLQLVYTVEVADRVAALQLEYRIKQLPRLKKIQLINGELRMEGVAQEQSS